MSFWMRISRFYYYAKQEINLQLSAKDVSDNWMTLIQRNGQKFLRQNPIFGCIQRKTILVLLVLENGVNWCMLTFPLGLLSTPELGIGSIHHCTVTRNHLKINYFPKN